MSAVGGLSRARGPRRFLMSRDDLRMALVVTRREVRDSFRDWRIIIPIVLLTLFFPLLMNYTAGRLLNFVNQYGAEIIGTRLIPFLLLVVGFFPTSFSLVIALETFVGEKERKSLEPLLATPLSNVQLYLGKMLASVIPPLSASYMGISVYLVGLYLTHGWTPTWQLFVQTILLTTVQGVVMVAGAVIVSSQTTSARAANLLASFIIVPVALLIQAEAIAMFWGNYTGLWWVILGMVVIAVVLIRMGIHLFNREELLGRDIDQIRLGSMLRTFWARFRGSDGGDRAPGFRAWFRQSWTLLFAVRTPVAVAVLGMVGATIFGIVMARQFPFSPGLQEQITNVDYAANLTSITGAVGGLPFIIFLHNLRVVALALILGVFTLGVLGFLILMIPWSLLGFIGAQLALAGVNPVEFMLATVAPHATFELPAMLLVTAAALRWHTSAIAPPGGKTVSETWLAAAADFFRIMLAVVVPLFLAAALLEVYVTPAVVAWVYR